MSSETLHESPEKLAPETVDRHRAISSIMEELEAIDWYDQRVDATTDPELRAILAHNRDEEKEHASMVLEWLRRHDPTLDRHMREYLFTEGSITEREQASEGSAGAGSEDEEQRRSGAPRAGSEDGSLGIGCLKAEVVK